MNKTPSRISSFVAATALLAALTATAHAQGVQTRTTEIVAQPLNQALSTFAKQTGLQLIYVSELANGQDSKPIPAGLSAKEALTQLLSGTSLTYEFLNDRTVRIFEASAFRPASTSSRKPTPSSTSEGLRGGSGEPIQSPAPSKRSFWRMFRLAQAEGDSKLAGEEGISSDEALEEIVVTAQKKLERLQDVPVPVSTISGGTLLAANQLRMQDYFSSIPGVSYNSSFFGNSIVIRGLTTVGSGGFSNPTVGIVVDDVPYGSSQAFGVTSVPDIDPGELARIEVLRGPQGTLYGASSIGGLLKYVTVDPSTERVYGRLQGSASDVANGDRAGYNLRGSINVPVGETLAVRASAFHRRDPGYVDNLTSGEEAVNSENVTGGRVSALWRPSEDWSVKLAATLQDSDVQAASIVFPALGDLKQAFLRDTGKVDKKIQVYTANVAGKLGAGELTAISSYAKASDARNNDVSGLTPAMQILFPTATGVSLVNTQDTTKFTQELRFAMPFGERWDWLVGAFYTHEKNQHANFFLPVEGATGDVLGTPWINDDPREFREYAAFSDLTWKITDQFDVQFGARYSENKQRHSQTITGPFVPVLFGNPAITSSVDPRVDSKDNATTYLVTPRFRLSPDLMAYARFASGYRPGGPNNACALVQQNGGPCSFQPDRVKNYEVGLKGSLLDNRLAYDTSVYYIDWSDLQIDLFTLNGLAQFTGNGGKAKSQGVEFSIQARPVRGLELSAWVAYNEAELTEPFVNSSAIGFDGDWLPRGSRWSGNVAIEDEFAGFGPFKGFAGGSASYVGRRAQDFRQIVGQPQPFFKAYTRVDLHAGLRNEAWELSVFGTNVTDRRGILNYDAASGGFVLIQPRTIGLSLARNF